MIELRNLTKTYGEKIAANNVQFTVKPGEIFGFIGPNGAGKTTTLKMMTGIVQPTSGTAVLYGHDILKDPVEAKRKFVFVPDHPEVFSNIKGMDYLNFVADVHGISKTERKARIEKFAGEFGIQGDLGAKIRTYSHGMKQKLLIVSAFMVNPRILIFDEPHVGLDPQAMKLLKDKMKEFCAGGGIVFFSSHILEAVENLCSRIAIINKGEIVRLGSLDEIREGSDKSLEDLFLELTK
ncbi:MAG: ABC transporter ATP-binding protein [Bacillota bacterium]|nr:ABC transporter ATP-binding protein [Bacillota bacterium]